MDIVNLNKIKLILSDVQWLLLLYAVLLQAFLVIILSIKWKVFIDQEKIKIDFNKLVKLSFMGAFFNNILPSSSGGDALRTYYMYKGGYGGIVAITPIISERFIGLIAMLGTASIMLLILNISSTWVALRLLTWVIFLLLILTAFLLTNPKNFLNSLIKYTPWKNNKLISIAIRIVLKVNEYLKSKKLVFKVFFLSLASQIIQVIIFIIIALSINIVFPVELYFLATPFVFIALIAPFSIGGIGVRDMAIVVIFSSLGMANESALAISILFTVILVVSSIPGGIMFLMMKDHKSFFDKVQRVKIF